MQCQKSYVADHLKCRSLKYKRRTFSVGTTWRFLSFLKIQLTTNDEIRVQIYLRKTCSLGIVPHEWLYCIPVGSKRRCAFSGAAQTSSSIAVNLKFLNMNLEDSLRYYGHNSIKIIRWKENFKNFPLKTKRQKKNYFFAWP